MTHNAGLPLMYQSTVGAAIASTRHKVPIPHFLFRNCAHHNMIVRATT